MLVLKKQFSGYKWKVGRNPRTLFLMEMNPNTGEQEEATLWYISEGSCLSLHVCLVNNIRYLCVLVSPSVPFHSSDWLLAIYWLLLILYTSGNGYPIPGCLHFYLKLLWSFNFPVLYSIPLKNSLSSSFSSEQI